MGVETLDVPTRNFYVYDCFLYFKAYKYDSTKTLFTFLNLSSLYRFIVLYFLFPCNCESYHWLLAVRALNSLYLFLILIMDPFRSFPFLPTNKSNSSQPTFFLLTIFKNDILATFRRAKGSLPNIWCLVTNHKLHFTKVTSETNFSSVLCKVVHLGVDCFEISLHCGTNHK